MAFVTCSQFKQSQASQDEKIKTLEECCENNTQKNAEQDTRLNDLESGALSAEDKLLDKQAGDGAGKITAEKIKAAIAGDVEVAVDKSSVITGKGTRREPLSLDPNALATKLGSASSGANLLKALKDNGLLGDGLDVANGKLIVKTTQFVDASGTVILGYGVNKE